MNWNSPIRIIIFVISLILWNRLVAQNANINLLGQLSYETPLTEVWGYEQDGTEYALVCLENGLSIVDISDPTTPIELGFYEETVSAFRDIQVYGNYAYVVNEGGGGLRIYDLSLLPGEMDHWVWTGDETTSLNSAHNVAIDQQTGVAYLTGSDAGGNSTLIIDLNSSPSSPTILGQYTAGYIDDAYVRNDTLWAAEIFNGLFNVIDVSNPSEPNAMGASTTPSSYTHACWLSNDGETLFTTDELPDAYLTAYDVSNLLDIEELDRYRSPYSAGATPHNVIAKDGFLIISYYKDGLMVIDATNPDILVETAHYDTSPLSGEGLQGCWGVHADLPSGVLLAADHEEGLLILCPDYEPASFLSGSVIDSLSSFPLFGVEVSFALPQANTSTDLFGTYKTGLPASGTFDVSFSKTGYCTRTIENVPFTPATLSELTVKLLPESEGCSNDLLVEPDPSLQDTIANCSILSSSSDTGNNLQSKELNMINALHKDRIIIENPFEQLTTHIYVHDINGRLILKRNVDIQTGRSSFALPKLNTGLYVINLKNNKFHKSVKMTKI